MFKEEVDLERMLKVKLPGWLSYRKELPNIMITFQLNSRLFREQALWSRILCSDSWRERLACSQPFYKQSEGTSNLCLKFAQVKEKQQASSRRWPRPSTQTLCPNTGRSTSYQTQWLAQSGSLISNEGLNRCRRFLPATTMDEVASGLVVSCPQRLI